MKIIGVISQFIQVRDYSMVHQRLAPYTLRSTIACYRPALHVIYRRAEIIQFGMHVTPTGIDHLQ